MSVPAELTIEDLAGLTIGVQRDILRAAGNLFAANPERMYSGADIAAVLDATADALGPSAEAAVVAEMQSFADD
jgi:hypothetical protein